ncbi:hypothetical protein [Anabaena sp. CCY 0017]|uniref:hypothetical protein n=1 Tax=Anabaena sp. CCY 0017 TaxID=3103866 RepID=UPI0039C5F600
MKNQQLQTKQQSLINASPEKLSLDDLSKISAGAGSGRERPDDFKVREIPDWRLPKFPE